MKLLAAADLHLGRALGGVPCQWADDYSPRQAWHDLIGRAISERVDAVLLAGDVVDRENRFFEAYGVLHSGVARLSKAAIPVIAVAGNHDTAVLPELASTLDGLNFVLLGVGGCWEWHDITDSAGRRLRIYGWSFPAQHHRHSPFEDPLAPGADAPAMRLGLLHCEYGQAASAYAPVQSHEIQDSGIPLWMLGHIHVPQCHTPGNSTSAYYPGSLQGLDAGESGIHGALLIDYDGDAQPTVTPIPIAKLAYLKISLPTADLDCRKAALTQALCQAIDDALDDDCADIEAVVVDLNLAGQSAHSASEFRQIVHEFTENAIQDLGNRDVALRKHSYDIRPLPEEINLPEIAGGSDLLGTLAQAIIALEAGNLNDPVASDMLAEVTRNVRRAEASPAFDQLAHAPLDAAAIQHQTIAKAYELLGDLHRQRQQLQESNDA